MNFDLLIEEVPSDYGKCIMGDCTAAFKCLRHQLFLRRSKEAKQLSIVNPDWLSPERGEQCPFFHSVVPVKLARGFQKALRSVPYGSIKYVQQALTDRYCRSLFYYYRKGERVLSPVDQDFISKILLEYGARGPIEFDAYEEGYVWNED